MNIAPGLKLGSYEIIALLGKGGMGEVWRAQDTRLDRAVAIKVLPASFANDSDRLSRFALEAKATSALNHPNILTVHDIGTHENTPYIVAELLEGEELRAKLDEGALPVRKAIEYAQQIAAGLAVAHEKGITHRDLKPENLFVTKDGRVKILDFGLAKLRPRQSDGATGRRGDEEATLPLPLSPARPLTHPGTVMGTVAYMSPEQVRGQDTDHRSDIFSFGIILHEMLSGQRTFTGESQVEVMNAILKEDPPELSSAKISPALDKIVRRCLEKKPEMRFHSAHDLGFALSTLTTPSGSRLDATATLPVVTESSPAVGKAGLFGKAQLWLLGAVLLGLLVGAGAVAWWLRSSAGGDAPVRALQLESGEQLDAPQISPDGRYVAYVREGKLMVRAVGSYENREIPNTSNVSNPFWSPDSSSIGYFTNGRELRAVSANGGANRLLTTEAFAPAGGSWGREGLVFAKFAGGLWIIPDGGQERQLVKSANAGESLTFPWCLADGRVLAVQSKVDAMGRDRSIVVIDQGKQTPLFHLPVDDLRSPVFVAPETILFARNVSNNSSGENRGIWRIPVAPDLSSAVGPAVSVLPEASYPSVSADGLLVALAGRKTRPRQLVWVDRTGKRLAEFGKPQDSFASVALVGDGSRAFSIGIGIGSANRNEIWSHREATVQGLALSGIQKIYLGAAPSPTGDLIAFGGQGADGTEGLFVASTTGGQQARLLVKDVGAHFAWTPDGKSIVYVQGRGRGEGETGALWIVSITEGSQPRLLLAGASDPAISPDGRWLAYVSRVAGKREVYLTTFPVPGQSWPVSVDGGSRARWNPRGGELFFASGPAVGTDPNSHQYLSVAKVELRGSPNIGKPERLFEPEALGLRATYTNFRSYDIAPDGQRILLPTTGVEGTTTITVIENLAGWLRQQK